MYRFTTPGRSWRFPGFRVGSLSVILPSTYFRHLIIYIELDPSHTRRPHFDKILIANRCVIAIIRLGEKMINQVKQRGDCVPCHSDCPEAWNKDSRSLQ